MSLTTPSQALEIERGVQSLVEQMQGTTLEITGEDEARQATSLLVSVRNLRRQADEARKALVKPLQDHVKFINESFKARTAPLEEVESNVKDAIGRFERSREEAAEAARKAADEAARLDAERARVEAILAGEDAPLPEVRPDFVPDPQRIRGDGGSVVKSHRWGFKVEDFNAIDREWLVLDEKKVREYMRAELRAERVPKIPGITFVKELSVSVRGS